MKPGSEKKKEPILQVRRLDKTFPLAGTHVEVLKDLSLSVGPGETVAIVGASGAGKSTLLHIVGGIDRPTRGSVMFDGVDLYGLSAAGRTCLRSRRIGFVFQFYHLLPELDTLENVMLPAMNRAPFRPFRGAESSGATRAGIDGAGGAARERAMALLQAAGLADRASHMPSELSGGEQQRAALARALMNQPDLLLADEPTGNLDSVTGETVLDSIFELSREIGGSMLLATHNPAVAVRCDRMLKLENGRLTCC